MTCLKLWDVGNFYNITHTEKYTLHQQGVEQNKFLNKKILELSSMKS